MALVVVAADRRYPLIAQLLDDLLILLPTVHRVTEAHNVAAAAGFRVGERRQHAAEVAVNIGDQGDPTRTGGGR